MARQDTWHRRLGFAGPPRGIRNMTVVGHPGSFERLLAILSRQEWCVVVLTATARLKTCKRADLQHVLGLDASQSESVKAETVDRYLTLLQSAGLVEQIGASVRITPRSAEAAKRPSGGTTASHKPAVAPFGPSETPRKPHHRPSATNHSDTSKHQGGTGTPRPEAVPKRKVPAKVCGVLCHDRDRVDHIGMDIW